MKLYTGLLFFSLFFVQTLLGQDNYWSDVSESSISLLGERHIVPDRYRVLELDLAGIANELDKAPMRFEQSNDELLLQMPNPNSGEWSTYRILEVPTMEAGLQQEFPNMRTYLGANVENPAQRIRFDITMHGFHGMVLYSDEGSFFIDPYQTNDKTNYVCYFKKDYYRETGFQCHVKSERTLSKDQNTEDYKMAGDCQLRTYRLANAATAEYTTFHGGTVAAGQAAIVTAINRVNEIYEIDFAITLVLIDNNSSLVYTNSGTDPYSNNNGGTMLGQNQSNIDNVIGSANYDIGHVFSTGGGGIAGLGVICSNGNKARGVTGLGSPVGDPFAIDYVAHEMGHQFGGNHSYNNSCSGNRNNGTAVEPGSGSTIMAYAGICSPNVQNFSDAYFHAISIEEMSNFSNNGGGNNCPVTTVTGNNQPTVSGGSNQTIPGGTPFELTAVGNDADGDALTYNWEQMDITIATMPPNGSNTGGPAFRSLFATTSPTRYFPSLDNIINNTTDTWEVLATVDRSYDFRVTVRDNNLLGGCTDEDDVVITIDGDSGPFLVNSPNTNVTWSAGANETVTWDVANTNNAPVSCSNVDILLSTDGGNTFPITLASSVPNNGSYTVSVPPNASTTCRVKVICSDNVFFDMSNTNFEIEFSAPTFTLIANSSNNLLCGSGTAVYDLDFTSLAGFNSSVNISATGGPAGASFSFSNSSVVPNASETLQVTVPSGTSLGSYTIDITASGGGETRMESVDIVIADIPSQSTLSTPVNGATNEALGVSLNWVNDPFATTYLVEIATDMAFTNIVESSSSNTNTYTASMLGPTTTYYWRVTPSNNCGIGSASTTFNFETTTPDYCESLGTDASFEWIETVVLNTINNNSGGDDGYGDYTGISTDLEQGQSYSIDLTPGFANQTYLEKWVVWIDFNRNGEFTDPGEEVYASDASSSTVNGNLSIPSTASLGTTLMRVGMKWAGNNGNADASESCETFQYGEVEDYSINIISDAGCADSDADSICDSEDVCPGYDDLLDTNNNNLPDDCEPVSVNLTVILEGAYDGNNMNNQLSISGLLPSTQPYQNAPYNYGGNEVLSVIGSNLVDWVLVELRTGPNPADKIESHAGILLTNGNIVASDGSSPLSFTQMVPGGNYYFVVRHRNHLDIMTANAVPRSLVINYDFTTDVLQAYGAEQQAILMDGKAGMFAGDITQDLVIQSTDYDAWRVEPALLNVYEATDLNLDGTVQTTDYDAWFVNKAKIGISEIDY